MKLEELIKDSHDEGLDAFYISFGDLMVILSVFFVMLLTMSNIEVGSFEKIRSVMTGKTENTLVELQGSLEGVINGQPGIPGASVHLDSDGLRVDLDTSILFDQGKAVIKKDILKSIRPVLVKILSTDYRVDVEGHTDDVAYYRIIDGETVTNWSLSGKRASSMILHLKTLGFSSERLRVIGYADTRPVVDTEDLVGDDLDAARARNRRVSLLIR